PASARRRVGTVCDTTAAAGRYRLTHLHRKQGRDGRHCGVALSPAVRVLTGEDVAMYNCILVPIDLAETELAKPAITAAVLAAKESGGTVRLINVLPLTPVMLAEYVPPDFETQQRKSAEDALSIICRETGLDASKATATVRQGGIYQEILEEAKAIKADLIVMSSHR